MSVPMKDELRTFVFYFCIALVSEIAGFIGWLNKANRGGDMFKVETAFWVHVMSRLSVWLPVFVGLAGIRLLIVFVSSRFNRKREA